MSDDKKIYYKIIHYFSIVFGEESAIIILEESVEEAEDYTASTYKMTVIAGSLSVDEDFLETILIVTSGINTDIEGIEIRSIDGIELSIVYLLDQEI